MKALQFLEARFSALNEGDYAAVYDSYHENAPFRKQFCDRGTYIRFARQQLSSIGIESWRCQRQRIPNEKQLEVLLVMEMTTEGEIQFFYELALLIETDAGWTYLSAQKLGVDDYSGSPDQIDFHHFDNAAQKIRF